MSEQAVSVSEAAKHLAGLVSRIVRRRESTLLLKRGKPVARLVPLEPRAKTGRELAKAWFKRAHLTPREAAVFESDLAEARRRLPAVKPPSWE
jgi:antitoxin (DNA-binding transcriptional repressor) of toxin-antitoxin stability system